MPIISQFYGIIIKMYHREGVRHYKEHIHIVYNQFNAVYSLNGEIIEGNLPIKQRKMVEAWIAIHEDELKALWKEIKEFGNFFRIQPLK